MSNELTQADIERIRANWTYASAKDTEALLAYAEYGLKAKEFFREKQKKAAMCEEVNDCTDCPVDDCQGVGEYAFALSDAKIAGLLEQEQPKCQTK